jgi:hypothetical protein
MIQKQWLTVPIVGTGRADDPYRPDLPAAAVWAWVLAATDHQTALVLVGAEPAALDALIGRGDVVPHGDPIDAARRARLLAEARRLGAPADWSPTACAITDEPA